MSPIWYWRGESFKGLADVCASARVQPELAAYADYLQSRERGLRKEAFSHLRSFIATAEQWPFGRRREFVDWLLSVQCSRPAVRDLVPQPLQVALIQATLDEWVRLEPGNPVPYRWRGTLDDLRTAIRLDPAEQIARERLLRRLVAGVEYSVHELPHGYGYIGSPTEDLALLDETRQAAEGLADVEMRTRYTGKIADLDRIVRSYINYRSTDAKCSYVEWTQRDGRPFGCI